MRPFLDTVDAKLSATATTLVFVDGNHENFDDLYALDVDDDGFRRVRANIWHALPVTGRRRGDPAGTTQWQRMAAGRPPAYLPAVCSSGGDHPDQAGLAVTQRPSR